MFAYAYLDQILLLSLGEKSLLNNKAVIEERKLTCNMESKYHTAWNSQVKKFSAKFLVPFFSMLVNT